MVGVLIATHGGIGHSLMETASDLVGEEMAQLAALTLDDTMDRAEAWDTLVAGYEAVDTGSGVLVLVDMFGSPASTLALSLLAERSVEVLTGVNLAMVLRALLRRDGRTLSQLADDVLSYGIRNVTSSATWLSAPSPETSETT
jgi:PTS system mannose-specific IIA component